jgi:hypothetical protein
MSESELPAQPSVTQLKHPAKDLLKAFRAGSQEASARFGEHHPGLAGRTPITPSDLQLVIAREYGFVSWPKLRQQVELLADVEARVVRLRSEFAAGDPAGEVCAC